MKNFVLALIALVLVVAVFIGYRPVRAHFAYQAVHDAMSANMSCQQDSDCVTIGSGSCETGCYMTFNKSAESQINDLVSAAADYRDTSCHLDCMAPPTPKCVQNVCSN